MPHIILLGNYRDKLEYPELRRKAQEYYDKYKPDRVIIEKKSAGISLIQDLQRAGIPVMKDVPDRDKVARAYAVTPVMQQGRVFLPKGKAFANDLYDEALSFTAVGSHANDDQVDCLTLALSFVIKHYKVSPELPKDIKKAPKVESYWSRLRKVA